MQNISEIDKNFKVCSNIQRDGIVFRNVTDSPFGIYGVFWKNGKFRRMPEDVAKTVSDRVYALHARGAGGRVRFKTDSKYVAIIAKMNNISKMPHCAITGSSGFDMYIKNNGGEEYYNTFVPPFDIIDGYESVLDFDTRKEREITINFPLYSDVRELYIGLEADAVIKEAAPYRVKIPVVYYGSSITQGGCASRPGNSYQAIVSRRFDCDYINLGFSGSAKGEIQMADYIKKLNMSLFVYDYDHNAPTTEHLINTHERMFKAVREEQRSLPIIIMSRPKFNLTEEEQKRLEVIRKTYNNAVASGDKNVYLIDGKMLTELCRNNGTVDNGHPNDFGFASMAKALGDVIEKGNIF